MVQVYSYIQLSNWIRCRNFLKMVWIFTKRNTLQIIMLIIYSFCSWKYLVCYNWISATIPRSGVAQRNASQNVHELVRETGFFPMNACIKVKSEAWLCFGCNAANPTDIGYKCRQDVHEGTSMEDFARWWLFFADHRVNTLKLFCWRITQTV
jgi:hypothetical protein